MAGAGKQPPGLLVEAETEVPPAHVSTEPSAELGVEGVAGEVLGLVTGTLWGLYISYDLVSEDSALHRPDHKPKKCPHSQPAVTPYYTPRESEAT